MFCKGDKVIVNSDKSWLIVEPKFMIGKIYWYKCDHLFIRLVSGFKISQLRRNFFKINYEKIVDVL